MPSGLPARYYPNGQEPSKARDLTKNEGGIVAVGSTPADDAAPLPPASSDAPCVDFLQHRAGRFRSRL